MTPERLETLARHCKRLIEWAEDDGISVTDSNVVDLIADQLPFDPIASIRVALLVAGYGERFPRATEPRAPHAGHLRTGETNDHH